MNDFDKLKAELGETMLKAQSIEQLNDDQKIEQAADGADKNDPPGGGTQDDAAAKDGDAGWRHAAVIAAGALGHQRHQALQARVVTDDQHPVEVPTVVDANGVHPIALESQPSLHQLGLMASVKAVERQVIEAAVTGSPDLAYRAFGQHPLVGSTRIAEALVDGYRDALPEVGDVLIAH